MQLLRSATQSAHQRIERALPSFDPSLTRARYIGVLRAFHGFYVSFEPLCRRAAGPAGATLDLATRVKLPLLTADLSAMGHSPWHILTLPRCRNFPTVTSTSQAMGALYVIEGATLGGQLIRRHLLSVLDLDAGTGAAFFTGYGERTRDMWTRFAGHVDRAAGLDVDAMIVTAIETFDALERWFVESLAAR
jgi:heme oxygenase